MLSNKSVNRQIYSEQLYLQKVTSVSNTCRVVSIMNENLDTGAAHRYSDKKSIFRAN